MAQSTNHTPIMGARAVIELRTPSLQPYSVPVDGFWVSQLAPISRTFSESSVHLEHVKPRRLRRSKAAESFPRTQLAALWVPRIDQKGMKA